MGILIILDFSCEDKQMANKRHIHNFLNGLVKTIKMNKLTEPIVKEGTPYLPGVSGFVMIETSHIAIHTFTNENRVNMDVYSCKNFNEIDVMNKLDDYFRGLVLLNKDVLRRDDGQMLKIEKLTED